jgi:peptidyl-dipeptidase Dcp
VITLSRSHIVPFLTFSERRDLREKAWRAWTSRGEHAGASDNRPSPPRSCSCASSRPACTATELRRLRPQRHDGAQPGGGDVAARAGLAAGAGARRGRARGALGARALARRKRVVEPWDWRFYAEKVRQVRFDLDEAAIKPYFPLERMVAAAFDCAARLFGVSFVPRPDIPRTTRRRRLRSPQAGRRDRPLPARQLRRPSKRSGAWMSSYRMQSRNGLGDAAPVLPIIVNNNNFAKGAPGAPTLLSFDDARTLFHEFGHGLHGLLSNVTYERVSGTSVLRDFVELPSQLFEHWLEEPAVLKRTRAITRPARRSPTR